MLRVASLKGMSPDVMLFCSRRRVGDAGLTYCIAFSRASHRDAATEDYALDPRSVATGAS